MPLDTGQQVRLRIQDIPTVADLTYTFDGSAKDYALPHRNITSATAYVGTTGGWSATGATFNVTGFVQFATLGSANSAWRARYVYSTFSDDEIGHFTAVGGSIAGAALEAVHTLLFDSLKRAEWAAPDGSTWDDTKAQDTLLKMRDALREEIAESEIGGGGFVSWAQGQGDW